MTRKEFLQTYQGYGETIRSFEDSIIDIRQKRKELVKRYVDETFAASGYTVGQKLTDGEGKTWYVSGARECFGDVYLALNPARKDGSMSKVTFIARGEPHICIN